MKQQSPLTSYLLCSMRSICLLIYLSQYLSTSHTISAFVGGLGWAERRRCLGISDHDRTVHRTGVRIHDLEWIDDCSTVRPRTLPQLYLACNSHRFACALPYWGLFRVWLPSCASRSALFPPGDEFTFLLLFLLLLLLYMLWQWQWQWQRDGDGGERGWW